MATIDILLHGYSFGTDSGTPAFCSVILVESEGRRVLVDTAHVGRRVQLQEALAARGLTADDIDVILMTHAHWDHVQNFDAFPNTPMAIHPWERKYASEPHVNDWATPKWTGAAIETHTLQEVSGGDELAKGVTVIDLPGHSPGSIGLLVETEAGIAGLTGDAMHTAAAGIAGRSPLVFYNEDAGQRQHRQDRLGSRVALPRPRSAVPNRRWRAGLHRAVQADALGCAAADGGAHLRAAADRSDRALDHARHRGSADVRLSAASGCASRESAAAGSRTKRMATRAANPS